MSILRRLSSRSRWLSGLAEAGVTPPLEGTVSRWAEEIPSSVILRLCDLVSEGGRPKPLAVHFTPHPEDGRNPMLRGFKDSFRDVPRGEEAIDLQQIVGVTRSTCRVRDFEMMQADPTVMWMQTRWPDADSIFEDAMKDGIRETGRRVAVRRQGFDGRQWIANPDGSHRIAAVWGLDRKAGRSRMIECEVTERVLQPSARAHAEKVACWIFTSPRPRILSSDDFRASAIAVGIEIEPLENHLFDKAEDQRLWTLAVGRHTRAWRKVRPIMKDAFDVSELLLRPEAADFPFG